MSMGSDKAFVDGDEKSGVKPISVSGRVLVPVRFISEALGAKVGYNAKTGTVNIVKGKNTITLKLGSKNMYVNDNKITLDVAARTYNNITYLPLRPIGEALGKKVSYKADPDCGGVKINLIFIYEPNGKALDDAYKNPGFPSMCSLLFQGKNIIYGDRFFGIYKGNDGQLYIWDNWTYDGSDELLSDFEQSVKIGYNVPNEVPTWNKTPYGVYFIFENIGAFNYSSDIVYKIDGEKFQRICEEHEIADIKFIDKYVYLITHFNLDEKDYKTNLKRYSIDTPEKAECLGPTGYFYGFQLDGYIDKTWEVKEDGVYIIGYYRLLNIPTTDKKSSYAKYKVSLTGNSQEKISEAE
ncbi:copper amine oxidase N-terminal domain-containing protein [Desulfoscipio gibsoniae]|nr:copper amine oxidase N-terminal domain-containing protein [Desulfoscipio gibsoniae]